MFGDTVENYEGRKVAKETSKSGIVVSTALTSDEGYETALLDKNGTHPVERYGSLEKAKEGHKRWVKFADSGIGKTINKLGGFGGTISNRNIKL